MTQQLAPPTTPAAPAASRPPRSSRARAVGRAVLHRWPTLLALAWAAVMLVDVGDGTESSLVLVAAAVGYLTVAVIERPRATWPLLFVFVGIVVALRLAGLDERLMVIALGVVLAAVGLARGSLRRPGLPSLQVPAGVLFIGAGLVGATVAPEVGLYVIAVGLIAHSAWDAYHWRRDQVVVRAFAEWCGVLDLVVGVGILVLV